MQQFSLYLDSILLDYCITDSYEAAEATFLIRGWNLKGTVID